MTRIVRNKTNLTSLVKRARKSGGLQSVEGFTLAELLISAGLLALVFVAMLYGFIKCLELTEMSQNSSIAVTAVKTRMELIKNTPLAQIVGMYHNTTFTTAGLNGMGVSYVTNTNPDLFQITITFCWRQKNGRVIGEDTNLNGQLNAGEDQNGNGILDSTVQIVSYIYNG